MDAETKRQAITRLRRVGGQVQGVQRMLEDGKDCADILLQISAIRGALEQVARILMARHVESCVAESVKAGSERERTRKIEELIRVFSRHSGFGVR